MVERKKAKVPLWITLPVILLVAVGIVFWGIQKEEWVERTYSKRELNIMELDENLTSNDDESTDYIRSIGEFQMKGTLMIEQGTVEVTIRMGERELLHEIYGPGEYEFETEVYNAAGARASGASEVSVKGISETYVGMVIWDYKISDDAEGTYTTGYYTRRTNFERFYDRLRDMFTSEETE